MNDPFGPNPLSPALRVMRIIHLTLCIASAALLGIMAYQRQYNPRPVPADPTIDVVAIGFAVLCVPWAFFLPAKMDATWRSQVARGQKPGGILEDREKSLPDDPRRRWAALYQTRLVLRCGLLEGPTFAEALFYFITGNPVLLGLGIGLWVLLVVQYPTLSGLESWIDTQESLAQQQRGLDGPQG